MRRADFKVFFWQVAALCAFTMSQQFIPLSCSIAVRKINSPRLTSKQRLKWSNFGCCFSKPLLLCYPFPSCTFQTEEKATSVSSEGVNVYLAYIRVHRLVLVSVSMQHPWSTSRSVCWWQGWVLRTGLCPYCRVHVRLCMSSLTSASPSQGNWIVRWKETMNMCAVYRRAEGQLTRQCGHPVWAPHWARATWNHSYCFFCGKLLPFLALDSLELTSVHIWLLPFSFWRLWLWERIL